MRVVHGVFRAPENYFGVPDRFNLDGRGPIDVQRVGQAAFFCFCAGLGIGERIEDHRVEGDPARQDGELLAGQLLDGAGLSGPVQDGRSATPSQVKIICSKRACCICLRSKALLQGTQWHSPHPEPWQKEIGRAHV